MIKISAVICTHNRVSYLKRAIQSLICQSLDPREYEILVVDNASVDNTQETIGQFTVNNLNYLYEAELGLSNARNQAIRQARGEIIAFMDDDAVADREWLRTIVNAFEKVKPTPACVGGRVKPIWEAPKPDWFPDAFLGMLSLLDFGDAPHWCDPPRENLVGCNIAFLKKSLCAMGRFNPILGRKGQGLKGYEENMLLRELKHKGEGIYYDPQIIVHHFILKERLRRRWLIRRLYREGIDTAEFMDDDRPAGETHCGIKYLVRNLSLIATNTFRALFTLSCQQRTFFSARVALFLGKMVYVMKSKLQL